MLNKSIFWAIGVFAAGLLVAFWGFCGENSAGNPAISDFVSPTIAWADTFYEDFTTLTHCNAAKTNGGWNLVDEVGFHRRKPPFERSTAGWTNLTGYPQKIAVSGDIAYCANISGIVSVRISSGTQINSAALSGGNCVDIAISGGYAYVCATDRLLKVDLSDFSEDGSASYTAYGVAVSGDYAFLGSGTGGLRSIATSSMTQAGYATWTNCDARGVEICGDFALVADANKCLVAVDISSPSSPTYCSDISASVGSGGYYVAVAGTMAAVAGDDSIYIVGLTELTDGDADYSMNVLARFGAKVCAYDCEFFDDKLLVADADSGMLVFSIENPVSKSYMITSTPKNANGVSVKGVTKTETGIICVADSEGVQFVSMGNVSPASSWADQVNIGDAIAMVYSNNYVFVSCQDVGVVSVDVSDPTNLVAKDTLAIVPPLGLDVEGDKLYLCRGSASPNFYVIDVSNPASMSIISSTTISSTVWDVDVFGSYAYLACGDGVKKVSLSDLSVADYYNSEYPCVSLLVDGSYIYVGESEGGLLILNSSTLDSVGRCTTSGHAWGLAKSGDYCYVASKEGGLYKIDVSTPSSPAPGGWSTNPVPTSTFNGEPVSVNLYDNYLLVGLLESPDNDLVLVDQSDGSIDYTCPTGTWLAEASVGVGRYVILADYMSGIKSWLIKGDVTDTLAQNTHLESNKINTSQFRYVHWKAKNITDSDNPTDTVTYYLLYPGDTLLIMNNDNDPPDRPTGERAYFDLGNTYDSLSWAADIVEHNLYPSATDTVWRVDSIEIEYRTTPGLLRAVAGGFTCDDGETLAVEFAPEYTSDIDPGDVMAPPDAPVFFEYRGERFVRLALGYDEPVGEVSLVCARTVELAPFGAEFVSFVIDGEEITSATTIPAGEHSVDPIPAPAIRFPFRLSHGWNMVSIPSTAPVPAELFGMPEVFFYQDGAYGLTPKLEPGRGYFLWRSQKFNFVDGIPAKRNRIYLRSGWNLIGGISEPVSVYSLRTVPDSAIARYCVYTLNAGGTDYDIADRIEPKVGYWVFAFQPCTLVIDADAPAGSFRRPRAEQTGMVLLRDGENSARLRFGIRDDAAAGFDPYDRILPPPVPGKEVLGGFACGGVGDLLSVDVRPADKFDLVINRRCEVEYLGGYSSPVAIFGQDISVVLDIGEAAELAPGKYLLSPAQRETRTPVRTSFTSVAPNPFNSAVEITVELAGKSAQLQIVDISGRVVREYRLEGAGVHTIVWFGDSQDGGEVPSGVYFARLSGEGISPQYAKMLFVK